MFRWFYKFFFMLGMYGGLISFCETLDIVTNRTPKTFDEWDMYLAIGVAFSSAFFNWRRFL